MVFGHGAYALGLCVFCYFIDGLCHSRQAVVIADVDLAASGLAGYVVTHILYTQSGGLVNHALYSFHFCSGVPAGTVHKVSPYTEGCQSQTLGCGIFTDLLQFFQRSVGPAGFYKFDAVKAEFSGFIDHAVNAQFFYISAEAVGRYTCFHMISPLIWNFFVL